MARWLSHVSIRALSEIGYEQVAQVYPSCGVVATTPGSRLESALAAAIQWNHYYLAQVTSFGLLAYSG